MVIIKPRSIKKKNKRKECTAANLSELDEEIVYASNLGLYIFIHTAYGLSFYQTGAIL